MFADLILDIGTRTYVPQNRGLVALTTGHFRSASSTVSAVYAPPLGHWQFNKDQMKEFRDISANDFSVPVSKAVQHCERNPPDNLWQVIVNHFSSPSKGVVLDMKCLPRVIPRT